MQWKLTNQHLERFIKVCCWWGNIFYYCIKQRWHILGIIWRILGECWRSPAFFSRSIQNWEVKLLLWNISFIYDSDKIKLKSKMIKIKKAMSMMWFVYLYTCCAKVCKEVKHQALNFITSLLTNCMEDDW